MGKNTKPKTQKHKLTEKEFNLLKIMNLALSFNELKNKIFSGFLYIICYTRLGYNEDVNLVFEIDLDKDDMILRVTEVTN